MTFNITWRNKTFEVTATKYIENGNTCIVVLDPGTGQVEAKATTNLGKLPEHEVFIKDYSENRGLAEALTKARIIEGPLPGKGTNVGSQRIKRYRVSEAFAEEAGIKLPKPEPVFEQDDNASNAIEVPDAPAPEPVAATPADIVDASAAAGSTNVKDINKVLKERGRLPIKAADRDAALN